MGAIERFLGAKRRLSPAYFFPWLTYHCKHLGWFYTHLAGAASIFNSLTENSGCIVVEWMPSSCRKLLISLAASMYLWGLRNRMCAVATILSLDSCHTWNSWTFSISLTYRNQNKHYFRFYYMSRDPVQQKGHLVGQVYYEIMSKTLSKI